MLELTELRYRNEYLEKKLAHCIEIMMERGVNFEWPPKGRDGDASQPREDREDNEFGKDFQATKMYIDRSVEAEDEKLKVYLNKVLRRCEKLESKCHFLEDLQEQTKILAQQPSAKGVGGFVNRAGDIEEIHHLKEELRRGAQYIKELEDTNGKIKSDLLEEQRRAQNFEKELVELSDVYNAKRKYQVSKNLFHLRLQWNRVQSPETR